MLDTALTVKENTPRSHTDTTSDGKMSDWRTYKHAKGDTAQCLGWEDLIRYFTLS